MGLNPPKLRKRTISPSNHAMQCANATANTQSSQDRTRPRTKFYDDQEDTANKSSATTILQALVISPTIWFLEIKRPTTTVLPTTSTIVRHRYVQQLTAIWCAFKLPIQHLYTALHVHLVRINNGVNQWSPQPQQYRHRNLHRSRFGINVKFKSRSRWRLGTKTVAVDPTFDSQRKETDADLERLKARRWQLTKALFRVTTSLRHGTYLSCPLRTKFDVGVPLN